MPIFNQRPDEVAEQLPTTPEAVCVSASFCSNSAKDFSSAKYNYYGLPVGHVYVDAWVMESLDPYAKDSYAILSS